MEEDFNWDDFDAQTAEYLNNSPAYDDYAWTPEQESWLSSYLSDGTQQNLTSEPTSDEVLNWLATQTPTDPEQGINITPGWANFMFPQSQDFSELYSPPKMTQAQYEENTANPTEQELIDWVSSSDMPMDDKIAYLQKLKLEYGLVDPDAYSDNSSVVSPDEESKLTLPRDIQIKLREAQQAQLLKQLQAQQKFEGSGLGQALSGLSLAGLLAQSLVGKNNASQTTSRSNKGQTFAPTYQASSAPKTKYASGGGVNSGGLLRLAEQMMAQMASQKGLLKGNGGGQDDVIDIKAAPGEYVMDAETVSHLGDGNNDEGARKLDQMRINIRKHKRGGALSAIAPSSKAISAYMKEK